jgi:hypothetical protein
MSLFSDNPIAMEEVIDDTRKTLEQETRWAYPIALKLYQDSHHLPIDWAVECLRIYLSEFKPSNITKLNKYIAQALDMEYRDGLTSSQCIKIANELCYLPEEGDNLEAAIARLWWAISNKQDSFHEAGRAIELLLPDKSNSLLFDLYLEAAVRIYKEYGIY